MLYKRLKANGVMLWNAASLVATFCVKAGLGFAYWWVAARHFSPSSVGFASAAISALTLLGTLCMLGFGTLLIRELPKQRGQEVVLISTALILAALAGGCVGLLFALGVPFFSVDLQPLRGSILAAALFAIGVGLTAVNLVLDQALIGFLRGDLQLWRNILFASAKLAALTVVSFWFSQRTGLSIFITWMIGDTFSLLVLGGYALIRRKWNGRITLPRWQLLRTMGPLALQHHILNLLLIGPNYLLPLLVATLLSTTMNAWFYIAFLIADIVYVVPQALVTALYAVSSAQPAVLMRKIRLSMGLALLTCLLTLSVLLPASKLLLEIFGSGYADQGVWSMRILGLGAIPFLVKDHYVTICRVQDRISKTLLPLTYGAVLEVGLAIVGAHFGSISGLSLGWVIAVCIEAIFMAPTLYRTAWPHNLETNDSGFSSITTATFQSTYTTFLQNIRTVYPTARIFVLRTFAGVEVAPTQAAIQAVGDSNIQYVDTTGWLSSSDTNDGTHPSDAGHIKLANQLGPILGSYLDITYTPIPTSTLTPTPTVGTTPTPTMGATPTPGSTPIPVSGCTVHYAITNQWPGGFGASITIINTGTTAINGWRLGFSFPNGQTITQGWNGTFSQTGSAVTISNASYNGSIPAGATLGSVPGFNGFWTSTNGVPMAFTLNGTTCTVS